MQFLSLSLSLSLSLCVCVCVCVPNGISLMHAASLSLCVCVCVCVCVCSELQKEHFDKELHGDDVCFDTIISFETGCWLLFAAALCYIYVGSVAMNTCRAVVRDRLKKGYETQHTSTSRMTRLGLKLGLVRTGYVA